MDVGQFELDRQDNHIKGYMLGFPHMLSYERQENAEQKTKSGKRVPDYKVHALVGDKRIPVGAAWEETAKSGASTYYDTTFDNLGPLFPHKIYARLVPSPKLEGVCSLMWDSPREKAAYEAKRSAPAQAPAGLAM